ncbi:MAG: hypothetical protein LBT83_04710 [Tannerella sp.]|nr:hypothetical protein [Tannerella sp.]
MEKKIDFENVETRVETNANEAIQPAGAPTGDGVNQEEKSTDKSSGRFKQAASVAGGAVAGAAGAALVMGFTTEHQEEGVHEDRPPHQVVSADEFNGAEVPVAHNLTPDMNFEQSFAAARNEVGAPGVFYYSGDENHPEGYYGTFYGGEWANLSPEYRDSFGNYPYHNLDDAHQTNHEGAGEHVETSQQTAEHQSEQGHPAAETAGHAAATDQPATGEQQTAEVVVGGSAATGEAETEEQIPVNPDDVTGGDTDTTGEVEVLGGIQYTEIDGQLVAVAPIRVDGHEGLLIDVDADGIIDYGVVDNGTENPDVEDLSSYGITHDDVNHLQEAQQPAAHTEEPYLHESPPQEYTEESYLADNQLPDYTNNAPVEDYTV